MKHEDIVLLGLGFAGVLLHCLSKIAQLKKRGRKFDSIEYFSREWPTVMISLVMVIIAIYCKGEIKALELAGDYLGFGFVAIGFMGQSLLATFASKVQSRIGIKEEDTEAPPAKEE